MRILLLSGAISKYEKHGDFGKAAPQMHPYGALCLAAVLEKHGFCDLKILDTELKNLSDSDVVIEIRKFKPDIVGITTYTVAAERTLSLLREIRRNFKDVILVAGGPHVTLDPVEWIEKKVVDYCCTGEGEYAFLDLVRALEDGKKVDEIPNLTFLSKEKVRRNPNRPLIENLDELPFPAFHLIKDDMNKYYPQPMSYRKRPVATLVTSRGCPYGCKFCSAKIMWTRKWRFNSASYIVDLIEHLIANYGIKEVCFFEDTFLVNKKRVIEFCELLKKRKIQIIWSASVNIRNIDEEIAKYMKEAGCWFISCGIETGNDEIMKTLNKPLSIKEVEQKLEMVSKIGIKIKGYFMLGHINDTKETIRQTIDFSKALPLFSANYSIYTPVPGSDFYDHLCTQDNDLGKYEQVTYVTEGKGTRYSPDGLTADYLVKIQKKAFLEFFLRFSQVMLYLRSIRSFEDIRRFSIMFCAAVILAFRMMKNRLLHFRNE